MPAKLIFLGVRGSYPVSLKSGTAFGGNTASVLLANNDTLIFLDAGTGIVKARKYISSGVRKIYIFLTHLHLDHLLGLPFFPPFYDPAAEIDIYAPLLNNENLQEIIFSLFNPPFSPITTEGIKARLSFHALQSEMEEKLLFFSGDCSIGYIKHNDHPLYGVLIYSLLLKGKKIVYATDVESPAGFNREIIDFASGAHILIHDSQYFKNDYFDRHFPKKGFGHSTVEMAVENARRINAEKLFLFHFDPEYDDQMLRNMLRIARRSFRKTFLAQEEKIIKI